MSYPQICRIELTPLQLAKFVAALQAVADYQGIHSPACTQLLAICDLASFKINSGETDFVVGFRSGDNEPYVTDGTIL